MLPWKLLFRFFSAMVLFATGGFAAGHDLPLPFTSPPEVAAPAPADPTTTTTAPPAVDDTTTTTTAPPVVVDPVGDPVAVDPPVTTDPTTPAPTTPAAPVTTTTTVPPTAKPAPVVAPPAAPVDGDAPSVCAAAMATICGPAAPAPAADDSHAARVQRCQDWWNSLADAFDHNNRPEWAARARQIAGRCDAMITQWEKAEQRWMDHQPKGDHNNDGHPDNGRGPGHDDHQSPPPPAQPKAKQVSRHGEGRH